MERNKAIDCLRALAVLLVLGRHCPPPTINNPSVPVALFADFMAYWKRGGWIGVDLFFVLSGFLVSGLLFREHQKFGSLSAKNFLIRRGLKIYPAFWLLILITAILGLILNNFYPWKLLVEVSFLQNYFSGLWDHTWSLAVEEHFYFFLLLYLLLLSSKRTGSLFRLIPHTFFILAVVCLSWRLKTSVAMNLKHYNKVLYPSHLRMDSLFCGVVISYYYHYHKLKFLSLASRYRGFFLICGVLALVPAFMFVLETTPVIYTFGLTLFYIGSGLILIAALTVDLGYHKATDCAAYIGSHSYSIYLWHLPVSFWILPAFARIFGKHWSWSLNLSFYFFGAILMGIGMALLVEFPVLRIRDRWFPSRS